MAKKRERWRWPPSWWPWKPEPLPPPPPPAPPAGEAAAVLDEVNDLRGQYELPALGWHDGLASQCSAHATDMARVGRLSHADWLDRLARAGFAAGGENVAAEARTAGEVVALWISSPGHRANLLGQYQYLGCGVSQGPGGDPYWCLLVA